MSKIQMSLVISSLIFSISSFAGQTSVFSVKPNPVSDDAALIQAVTSHKQVSFVKAEGLVVSGLLKDDTNGSPHQKFNVKLTSGQVIMIVSNLDMCEKIPVQVGDVVGAGGQFIPTGKSGGLLHWTHKDPKKIRPDGFIELGGRVFCQ
ncbi:MAG: DUF3465 domain-containing protein [Pseudobdellovibrio sp.]